ncbi:MAG: tetratricopeptide repeat protein, partial [Methanobacterium sp.]
MKNLKIIMKEDQNNGISHLKDYDSWVREGNEHFSLKEYAAALSCYDNALELDSSDSRIWDNRGVALSSLGQYH